MEHKKTKKDTEDNNNNKQSATNTKKTYFTVSYISTISESFLSIAKKFGFDITYSVSNTLKKFIKRGKR